ncbi:MAG: terminase family protein [Polyangiaceae bacterium]
MAGIAADLRHGLDPVAFAREALGISPDPWQEQVLRAGAKRVLLNCSRQAGKSTVAAVLALHRALFYAESLVLLVSPSMRQSGELFRKITDLLSRFAGAPKRVEDNRLSLAFQNGSRIVSLPSSENTVRGFSKVALIIEDEAAWVGDELYRALRPMLAVSGGRLVLMSTPFGRRGHFHGEWTTGGAVWDRVRVTAHEVPRIAAAFLEEEQRSLGAWRYGQEYLCQFVDTVGQLFSYDEIKDAVSTDVVPLADCGAHGDFFVGVDLGQANDYTAIAVVERLNERAAPPPQTRFIVDPAPTSPRGLESQRYCVRHLERIELGTRYPVIVDRITRLLASEPLRGRATLVVDATGVGRPVVDLIEAAGVYPVSVTITGGDATTQTDRGVRAPKRDLVSALQVLLQRGDLKIAASLSLRSVLTDELLAFQARINPDTAHDSYAAGGTGAHDDLVLALALACWRARDAASRPAPAPVAGISEPFEREADEDSALWVLGPSQGRPRPAYEIPRSLAPAGGYDLTDRRRAAPFLIR